jgi:hypothetical protein
MQLLGTFPWCYWKELITLSVMLGVRISENFTTISNFHYAKSIIQRCLKPKEAKEILATKGLFINCKPPFT